MPAVPRRHRSYSALRRLACFGRRSGRPSPRGPPRLGTSSDPAVGVPYRRRVGDFCAGSPSGLFPPRMGETLPGFWVVLVKRAVVRDPAERTVAKPSLRPQRFRLRDRGTSRRSESECFEAVLTRPASLRTYASSWIHRCSWSKARYRPAGLGFGRAGFAPAGRHTEFHELPQFTPFRPALPGRTSGSPGRSPTPGPHQIRTRRFPPSGSSAEMTYVSFAQSCAFTQGRGSGNARRISPKRCQLRRVRLLLRLSHLYQARFTARRSLTRPATLPLTPK